MKRKLCVLLLCLMGMNVYVSSQKSIADVTITPGDLNWPVYEFKGDSVKPHVFVVDNAIGVDRTLRPHQDYEVAYINCIYPGSATMTITGINAYTGTVSKNYTIVPKSMKNATIEASLYCEDSIYTGQPKNIRVSIRDKARDYVLQQTETGSPEGDFEVSFVADNINAGKASVGVKGKNNYGGDTVFYYAIHPRAIGEVTSINIPNQEYVGHAFLDLAVEVWYDDLQLKENTDYLVAVDVTRVFNAGERVDLQILGTGNFDGDSTVAFTVQPRTLRADLFDLSNIRDTVYTGDSIKYTIIAKEDYSIIPNMDFKVTYDNNVLPGQAGITVSALSSNNTGAFTVNFNIVGISMSDCKMTFPPEMVYTGDSLKTPVTLTYKNKLLTENKDYTLAYSDNVKAGVATVAATGMGGYVGTVSRQFRIKAKHITDAMVQNIPPMLYTADSINNVVRVTDSVKEMRKFLVEGRDYTVTYTNNLQVGTASVSIMGTGNYTDTVNRQFNIINAAGPDIYQVIVYEKGHLVFYPSGIKVDDIFEMSIYARKVLEATVRKQAAFHVKDAVTIIDKLHRQIKIRKPVDMLFVPYVTLRAIDNSRNIGETNITDAGSLQPGFYTFSLTVQRRQYVANPPGADGTAAQNAFFSLGNTVFYHTESQAIKSINGTLVPGSSDLYWSGETGRTYRLIGDSDGDFGMVLESEEAGTAGDADIVNNGENIPSGRQDAARSTSETEQVSGGEESTSFSTVSTTAAATGSAFECSAKTIGGIAAVAVAGAGVIGFVAYELWKVFHHSDTDGKDMTQEEVNEMGKIIYNVQQHPDIQQQLDTWLRERKDTLIVHGQLVPTTDKKLKKDRRLLDDKLTDIKNEAGQMIKDSFVVKMKAKGFNVTMSLPGIEFDTVRIVDISAPLATNFGNGNFYGISLCNVYELGSNIRGGFYNLGINVHTDTQRQITVSDPVADYTGKDITVGNNVTVYSNIPVSVNSGKILLYNEDYTVAPASVSEPGAHPFIITGTSKNGYFGKNEGNMTVIADTICGTVTSWRQYDTTAVNLYRLRDSALVDSQFLYPADNIPDGDSREGRVKQTFSFNQVVPNDSYQIVIKKKYHLSTTIRGITAPGLSTHSPYPGKDIRTINLNTYYQGILRSDATDYLQNMPLVVGDFNGDGCVDMSDMRIIAANKNQSIDSTDINQDGITDDKDFVIFDARISAYPKGEHPAMIDAYSENLSHIPEIDLDAYIPWDYMPVTYQLKTTAAEAVEKPFVHWDDGIELFGTIDRLVIYDVSGKRIYRGNAHKVALPKGIYLIHLNNRVYKYVQ